MVAPAVLLVGLIGVLGWQGAAAAEGVWVQRVEGVLRLLLVVAG